MTFVFIINPLAGKRNPTDWLQSRIAAAFADCPECCEVYITEQAGGATGLVRRRCEARRDGEELCFVGCGGDGTVAEVAEGIVGYDFACMGVVPCGTGNDFVKNYPQCDFTDITAQRGGAATSIDLIRCNGRLAVNICNAGLDANVARDITIFKRLPLMGGSVAYLVSLCKNFFGRRLGEQAVVYCDGVADPRCELMLLVIANGKYYGGSFTGAPEASVNDGLLDLSIVPRLTRPKILSVLPRYQKGMHTTDPELTEIVSYRKCRHVRVEYDRPVTLCLDGETTTVSVIDAEVAAGALRLWLPAPAVGAADNNVAADTVYP